MPVFLLPGATRGEGEEGGGEGEEGTEARAEAKGGFGEVLQGDMAEGRGSFHLPAVPELPTQGTSCFFALCFVLCPRSLVFVCITRDGDIPCRT